METISWKSVALNERARMKAMKTVEREKDAEIEALKVERDAMAGLCEEAAQVLERTANDTLDGRNMAKRLREAYNESPNN